MNKYKLIFSLKESVFSFLLDFEKYLTFRIEDYIKMTLNSLKPKNRQHTDIFPFSLLLIMTIANREKTPKSSKRGGKWSNSSNRSIISNNILYFGYSCQQLEKMLTVRSPRMILNYSLTSIKKKMKTKKSPGSNRPDRFLV